MTVTPGATLTVGRKVVLSVNNNKLCFARAVPLTQRELVTNSDQNMCGDIDTSIFRAQKGRIIAGWSLAFDLTWPIAEVLFPKLGVTSGGAGGPWTLGATDEVASFPVDIHLGGARHDMDEAFVRRYAFRGQKGGRPVQMELDVVGVTEVVGLGSISDAAVDFAKEFSFTHCSLTMTDSTPTEKARAFDRFMLQVDNGLVIEHNNSITMDGVTIGNRQAIFATSVPYIAADADLYFTYRDDSDGKKSVLVLNNGEKILTFTMPAGLSVGKSGSALGKADQVRTPVTMMLLRDDNAGTRVPPITITAADP